MKRKPKLTPAEWEIMEAVWDLGGEPSVREVLEHLFPNGEKAYTTVQTVLNTLEKKKLLTRHKTGLVNFYSPICSREELTRTELSSIVSRIFGGSIPAFANSLLSLDSVDLDEIKKIKRLIDRREKELREKES
ncbi:MAG: BlaI/MecI/CopY family transcriptional regulator [Candidatus Krumholzibacteriota bacterium]|nr:BlaI/MecI/CopY family transcriptional regulator [Candidatus Krumholzibacteriota bacterium]